MCLDEWPSVEFYYSSLISSRESEFLLNIDDWPLVHQRVKDTFEEEGIAGIQYLPAKLIDVVTNAVNNDYWVMNVLNYIEAYDMEKSKYTYQEKYDSYSFAPHNIVFDEKVCSHYDIFRARKNSMYLYISGKIKRVIEENDWIGFAFNRAQW